VFHRTIGELSRAMRSVNHIGERDGVLILAGQTGSGKTELAIGLAQRFDAEIVGADSRQIYAGMAIGTAAPTAAQRAAVPHHLIEFLDPHERYSAGRFVTDALAAIADIQNRGKRAIVAGGTGFYIRALTGGARLSPQADPEVRDRLSREARIHDAEFLHGWLSVRDPRRAAALHPRDRYRVMRALEIALSAPRTGLAHPHTLETLGIPYAKVFLQIDAAELRRRIEGRIDDMLARGLVEEAERIGLEAVAFDAVGYPQALAFAAGWCTFAEMRALLIRATRRYASRQAAWFRSEPNVHRVHASAVPSLAREMLGWV